jgi:esterase/lipase
LRGGNVGALAALTAAQLRAVADSVVTEASGLADSVVVVGLSMGGVIGAWIVQQRKVSRAVLIAPAIGVGRIPSLLQRPIIGLADRLPNVTRRALPDTSRPDREMGFSSRAAAEILELGAEVLHQAESQPPRTMHVTMLLNANDRTVRESASEALAAAWAAHGAGVSIFELPDSLRLPHNVIDAYRGVSRGDAVLHLLRALAYGQPPTNLVRSIPRP